MLKMIDAVAPSGGHSPQSCCPAGTFPMIDDVQGCLFLCIPCAEQKQGKCSSLPSLPSGIGTSVPAQVRYRKLPTRLEQSSFDALSKQSPFANREAD